jgi:uncharacterized lipoprotein YddW (UPF0748 family)
MIRTSVFLCAVSLAASACASAPPRATGPQTALDQPPAVEREFRGVWVAAVANLDWPSRPGLHADSQKAELVRILDRAQQLRLNVVILHVRPAGDALYASSLEPWSEYLTGAEGRPPEPYYDPLAFAVAQAHARGLELHAWFNPYRARHPTAQSPAAANHISRTHPQLVHRYASYLWMDPGEEFVRRRSVEVVLDVVRRYDVDGVHIDDYFYPYRENDASGREIEFPDSAAYGRYVAAGGALDRSDWRRDNVNRYVAELYAAVKAEKPWVKVGISPIGMWRPNVAPQLGGYDAYEGIFADARKWILDGTLDYLAPQLYWPIARVDASFPVLLDWWVKQNPHGRGVYAGLIPSNVNLDAGPRAGWRADEILGQIYITRGRPGAEGHIHFRMGSLMPDGALTPIAGADTLSAPRIDSIRFRQHAVQARRDTLTSRLLNEAYARPALVPAMTWIADEPPPPPVVTVQRSATQTRIVMEPAPGADVNLWVVQSRWSDAWHTEIVPAAQRAWVVGSSVERSGSPHDIRVAVVDRFGNMSERVRVTHDGPPGVIGAEWRAQLPVGYTAHGARRNLRPGDTLRFDDLRITVQSAAVDSASRTVQLRLESGDSTEDRSLAAGRAFNWNGYHVAIVAVYGPGELGAGLTAVEVSAVSSAPPHVAAATIAGDASLRLRVPHRITHVTLHHTGSAEPLLPTDDPVQKLRGLQAWGERDRNWWDVPYHYLIDLDGRVYEGRDWRYAGETNTTYDPAGHFLISVIGNYERQEPTRAQIDAIADMMAWALDRFGLPTDRIGGHYDYADTTCPGAHLRTYLEDGRMHRMVDARRSLAQVRRRASATPAAPASPALDAFR